MERGLKWQEERYDQLFQSVLCGIVQYRLDGDTVVFENANKEAIRIFGYTEEEFWAKTDWDLPSLIVEEDREPVMAEVGRLREVGDKSSYEYRLCQKNGDPCWIVGSAEIIYNADGRKIVQSVFLDIDERKKTQMRNRMLSRQVEASNEVLRLALEHTTTCEFYYYPQQRRCVIPERAQKLYHVAPEYTDMPESLADTVICEAYRRDFCEIYRRIHAGEHTAYCEFCTMETGRWCRETLSVISYFESGEPALVIGILEDITHQREIENALLQARSKDSLTGLYNKETGIRLVKECLAGRDPEDTCCMMLLDMDDFERINKEEGATFADAILQEVASILVAETGEDAIQLRLGGDEFMLLIHHCNKKQAVHVGPRIAELAQNLMIHSRKDIHISVSIGMCTTEVVDDYNSLYRCAESTLKYVKEYGKGQAACYLDTSNELGVYLTQIYTQEHPVNDINSTPTAKEEDIISFALELLGKSKKLDDAIFLLLARIGKSFHFDRVSIVEINRDYLSMHFTYQWAGHQEDYQLGRDVYITEENYINASHLYDSEGLCDYNYEAIPGNLASCLHGGIWNCGELVGIMSFEIDKAGYVWSAQQRKLLRELMKIISSFLLKARADAVSQAKTDFLSRMSHEIRTPMNAISGMTTIAKSVLDDRGKVLDCLNKIEAANGYLLDLINDILDMSRIESGKMEINYESVQLPEQMAQLEALLQPQARQKGIHLQFECQYTKDRPLLCDALRLNQVLINIIGNAIKFTEPGGTVTVSIEPVETAPKLKLRFCVTDTGIGIEPSAMKRIFNAFEQADKSTASKHGGTGLGLAISSRLVQMMGGTLEVKSRVGEGSSFYFVLPMDYGASRQSAPARAAQKKVRVDFHHKKILLAEDNELNQDIARTILEMNGFEVTCAADGQEALNIFTSQPEGYFDAILMDIRMPVMDGLESTRRIRTCGRADARTVPIVALSANAFDKDSRKSLESGMNGHLSKPLQVEQLLEMLGQCLQG